MVLPRPAIKSVRRTIRLLLTRALIKHLSLLVTAVDGALVVPLAVKSSAALAGNVLVIVVLLGVLAVGTTVPVGMMKGTTL